MLYDRSLSELMADAAAAMPNRFSAADVVAWFHAHYPGFTDNALRAHVVGLTANDPSRRHHKGLAPKAPVFFKVDRGVLTAFDADRHCGGAGGRGAGSGLDGGDSVELAPAGQGKPLASDASQPPNPRAPDVLPPPARRADSPSHDVSDMGHGSETSPGLTENEVVDALASYLTATGWDVERALHGHQRGVDVIAHRGELTLHVEAKGATSTRASSQHYGKPMTPTVLKGNVEAAFKTAAIASERPRVVSAMAFPAIAGYRRLVTPLTASLERLRISVIWVDHDGGVTVEGPLVRLVPPG